VNSIKEDAIIISKPIYQKFLFEICLFRYFFIIFFRLFQCYVEEHAIEDLLYYLADGLKRGAISLENYLKVCSFLLNLIYYLLFLFSMLQNFLENNFS
jgi:hypothetical protein